MINTYFRCLYNYIRLSAKKIFGCVKISGSMFHTFSKHTSLEFKKYSSVNMGKNIQSDGFVRIVVGNNAKLSIGKSTYFNSGCVISAMDEIEIGENCLFGPNVVVFDNNHKFSKGEGVSYEHVCSKIEIGNNCWIGSGAIILMGTTIGDNCVIGAGCKVSGNIPSGSIVTMHCEKHIHQIEDR